MTLEKLIERYKTLSPSHMAYGYLKLDKIFSIVESGVCHAGIPTNPTSRIEFLVGGFLPNNSQWVTLKPIFEWAMNPETSPWRLFIRDVTVIYNDDGLPKGWYIDNQDTLNNYPFSVFKNFLIFTRVLTEKFVSFKFARDLIDDYGMSISDALVFVTFIARPSADVYAHSYNNSQGGHWFLTDYKPTYVRNVHGHETLISVKRFETGDLNLDLKPKAGDPQVNHLFTRNTGRDKPSFNISQVPQDKSFTTRFSNTTRYKLETIIEHFYEWKKRNSDDT